ncbi:exosortase A [Duganella levis]|uniref:Exosortase A n=1 Tax=Duganella levis TaxID=2692169 RepID=A0ABW9VU05_9BURK|nr:exosortase A [Duganella levis]MYN25113.1 exosortase A [Duganella levis]
MNAGRAALLSAPSPAAPSRPQPLLRHEHVWLAVVLVAMLAMHLPTVRSIVTLWLRSATFNHGFLILPVAGWLIWRQRAHVQGVAQRPWPAGLLLLTMLGAVWMLSEVANVQVLQQYCLVLMGIATVATVLGRALAAAIAFPLAYTLLAVPFGEVLMPALIDFTAHFTVTLLRLFGIPVFHENNFISLPSGNWAVADACSGLRYLIASVALGMLYAGVNYRSTRKRLVFIAISLVLPIIANGLRACMVVLIGHWSDMKLAAGIDHLIYGWIFFGMVMAMLFWCGVYWRDAELPPPAPAATAPTLPVTPPAQFAGMAIAVIVISAIWPLLAAYILRAPVDATPGPSLTLAAAPAPWHASAMRPGDWHMPHKGQPQRISRNYSDGRRTVSLQLTWYRHQYEGYELLAQVQRPVLSGVPQWEEVGARQRTVLIATRRLAIRESIEQSASDKLLVWRWYRQDGVELASPQMLKLMLAKAKLSGGNDGGAEVVLASAYDDQPATAETAMRDLLAAMLPAIDQGLRHVDR